MAIGSPAHRSALLSRSNVSIAHNCQLVAALPHCTPPLSSWTRPCPHTTGTSLTMHCCAPFKAAGIAQRPQNLQQQRAASAAPRRTLAVVAHSQQGKHQPFRSAAAAVAAFGAASLLLLGSGAPPASAAGGRLPPVTESADRCALPHCAHPGCMQAGSARVHPSTESSSPQCQTLPIFPWCAQVHAGRPRQVCRHARHLQPGGLGRQHDRG